MPKGPKRAAGKAGDARVRAAAFLRMPAWLSAALVIAVGLAVYGASLGNGFVNWDDREYITGNDDLRDASLRRHFVERTEVMGNYHPLTMWSLALTHRMARDARTGRLSARPFHATDLALHLANGLLALVLLRRLGAADWVATGAALLFVAHPMHVESVAWASARKDVLHAFFWLAAAVCYAEHARRPRWHLLLAAFLLFALSVLAKAQAVSLVPVLFLIDWHLRRRWDARALLEKIPFVALALWAGLRAIAAQQAFASVQDFALYAFWQRLLFAAHGLFSYVVKFFVPYGLSAFHGYPPTGEEPWARYAVEALAVLAIALAAWRLRKEGALAFGLLFFLLTVALVLQLLPVGGAVVAERYTYLPYIGLAFAALGLLQARTEHRPLARRLALGATGLFIAVLAVAAHQRARVWKDGLALWSDAVRKSADAPKAWNNYGVALNEAGRHAEGLRALNEALRLRADYTEALYNRGLAHYGLGRHGESIADYTAAIGLDSTLAVAWHNRAGAYYTLGQPHRALPDALKALELGYPVDPRFIEVLRQQSGAQAR